MWFAYLGCTIVSWSVALDFLNQLFWARVDQLDRHACELRMGLTNSLSSCRATGIYLTCESKTGQDALLGLRLCSVLAAAARASLSFAVMNSNACVSLGSLR